MNKLRDGARMALEREPKEHSVNDDIAHEEGPTMEATRTIQREKDFLTSLVSFQKKVRSRRVNTRKQAKDYSAFGSTTAYEKQVIDTLLANGLSDAEIGKCLREL